MHLSETKKTTTTTTKQFKKQNFCSPGLSDRAAQVGQWMVLKRGTGLKGASWVSRGRSQKGLEGQPWASSKGLWVLERGARAGAGALARPTHLQKLHHVQLGVSFLLLCRGLAEQLCGVHLVPFVVLSYKS